MTAVKAVDLHKQFGRKTAVKALNLSIEQGELLALLGVNGAGKTTTVRMLSGLCRPTSGDAWILGRSLRSQREEIQPLIGISPQETAVAGNLTVRENLELMAGIYGLRKPEGRKKAEELLKTFSMEGIGNDRAKVLSGGQQRRLSIAMALISEPQLLFLDEPTLGLDVLARRELWTAIRALKGSVTIVLTTHYMEEAQALSDRIAVMAAGELRALGTLEQLKEQTGTENLEDAFVSIAQEGLQ